eukprot:15467_1
MADNIHNDKDILYKKIRGIGAVKSYLECFIPPYLSLSNVIGYFILYPFSIMLNMYYIIHNFIMWHTEYNESNSKYNVRYLKIGNSVVVHVEFIGLMLLIFVIIASYITRHDCVTIDSVKNCGSWSAFQLFYEFRPKSLMNYYSTCFSHHIWRLNQTSIKNYQQCKSLKHKILKELEENRGDDINNDLNRIMQETLDKLDKVIDIFEKTHDFDKKLDKHYQTETLPASLVSTMIFVASWIAFILLSTTLLLIGMMFLLMKLAQFSYLNDRDITSNIYSFEFLNTVWLFIAFCNQLWNICDIDAIKKDTIYKFVFMQQNAKFTRYVANKISVFDATIKQTLWNTFGLQGFLLAISMDSKFLHKLIVQDQCDMFSVKDLFCYNEKIKVYKNTKDKVAQYVEQEIDDISEPLLKPDDSISEETKSDIVEYNKWDKIKYVVKENSKWIRNKIKSASYSMRLQSKQQPIHSYIRAELTVTRYQQKIDYNKPFELFNKSHSIFIPGKCTNNVQNASKFLPLCKSLVFVGNLYVDVVFSTLLCVNNSMLYLPAMTLVICSHILSTLVGLYMIHKLNKYQEPFIQKYYKWVILLCVSTGLCPTFQMLSVLSSNYLMLKYTEKIRFYTHFILQNIPLMIFQILSLDSPDIYPIVIIALCLSVLSLLIGLLSLRADEDVYLEHNANINFSNVELAHDDIKLLEDDNKYEDDPNDIYVKGEDIRFNSYSTDNRLNDTKLIIKTNTFTNIAAMFEKIEFFIKWLLPNIVILSFLTSWTLSILSAVYQSNDWTLHQKLSLHVFSFHWKHIGLLYGFLISSTLLISYVIIFLCAAVCYPIHNKWKKLRHYTIFSLIGIFQFFAVIIWWYFQTNDNQTITNIIKYSSSPNYYYIFLVSDAIFLYSVISIFAILGSSLLLAFGIIYYVEILSFSMLFSFSASRFYFILLAPIFSVGADVWYFVKIYKEKTILLIPCIVMLSFHICWITVSVIHYFKHRKYSKKNVQIQNIALLKKWDVMYLQYMVLLFAANVGYLFFQYLWDSTSGWDNNPLMRICWIHVVSFAVILLTIKVKGKDVVSYIYDLNWVREWILISSGKTTISDPEDYGEYF